MKFKQNYQDEMDRLSPDDEQLERIRNGVYARLEREADNNTEPAPNRRKKPLRFKIAAISGGACACTCAAVLIIFMNGSVRNSGMAPMLNDTEIDCGYTGGAANSIIHDINCPQGIGGNQMDPTGEYSPPTSIISDSLSETNNASDGSTFGEIGSATAPSSNYSLYLMFSEDKSSCTVTMNGEKYVYREAEFGFTSDLSSEDYEQFIYESDNPLRSADSNLDIKLFVQFDENVLYVFTESGTLYKYYMLN